MTGDPTKKEEALPTGWALDKMGNVLPISYGKGLVEKVRDHGGAVPVYGSSGLVGTHSQPLTNGPTLIIGRKGSVGVTHYSPVPCWPIDTTYFVEATEHTNLRFFAYLLSALNLGRMDRSTAVPGLSRTDYDSLNAAVPPLPEQCRIVAEIEKQFTRLDAAVEALKRIRANLKRYRASVLKAACEGRLVPTEAELARAEGRDYEPADVLLQRILKERREDWVAAELASMQANGTLPSDDKWKTRYKNPVDAFANSMPPVPEGWCLASLEQLTSAVRVICYGILMPKENVADGVPYVKVKDIKGDRIQVEALHRTSKKIAAAYARASLKPGDLLLAIRGTYGRVAEVPPELDGGNITQDTARLDVSRHADQRFVALHLRGPDSQTYFKRVARGVAVKGVNIGDVKPAPILFPPQVEQHRIIAEAERRLSVIEGLEALVAANLKRAERLRQSILKRAFEGKLVPQDPNDEPASVLLERIRAERIAKASSAISGQGNKVNRERSHRRRAGKKDADEKKAL